MSTMSTKAPLLTVRESARRLGVHENTVRRWADRGMIEAVRLPTGVRRLRAEDVEALGREIEGSPSRPRERGQRSPKTLAELATEQGVVPIGDPTELAVPHLWRSDAEFGKFVAEVYAERDRDR